mgnify:CR=1 FL=1
MSWICLLQGGRLRTVYTIVWTAITVMPLLMMSGCLIKPRPIDTGEVRARAVKDYLAKSGKIEDSRLFVLSPNGAVPDKVAAGEAKQAGPATRADFTIK